MMYTVFSSLSVLILKVNMFSLRPNTKGKYTMYYTVETIDALRRCSTDCANGRFSTDCANGHMCLGLCNSHLALGK